MALTQAADLTTGYRSFIRDEEAYRPVPSTTYLPGMAVRIASQDLQVYPDEKTVELSAAGASQQGLIGIVADTWPGFGPTSSTPPNYTSPANLAALRGTVGIDVVRKGFHPGVLIDQSGSGAVTIVNRLALIASAATAGALQGGSATVAAGGSAVVANALLPAASLFGYSLTAAALAQASQTDTLTGTPAAGDILQVTIQTPYVASAPGVLQKTTWSTPPLTAAQATSVTTAALALLTYLNAQPTFSAYFIATQVAGVVTITVNALSTLFRVNYGTGGNIANYFDISLSGMLANSLTFAVATVAGGGTVSTAGSTTFASGTGFYGYIPALVIAP
jgi:hypothetical protein